MEKRVLFVVNSFEYFVSHRLPIALEARRNGWEVHTASFGEPPRILRELGLMTHSITLVRGGVNPFIEAKSIYELFGLFKRVRPELVHLVTTKPVLYGGLAARLAQVPRALYAVAGLGSVFVKENGRLGLLRRLLQAFYRQSLKHPNSSVIFQNTADRTALIAIGAVQVDRARLIPGSGVDLQAYPVLPEPAGKLVVTMAARLLRDKGVVEFVEAAHLLHERGVDCEFRLIGEADPCNPSTVTEAELGQWRDAGHVRLLGYRKDIAHQYAQSHVVCLPSYYGEGLPKCLIEAASCGRAVVTTEVPGCRDAIEPDVSGLLVTPRDARALADAIQRLIECPQMRRQMALEGRRLAESKFAIEKIVAAHMGIYRELLGNS